jgi:surface polysaccharide O-acyltransferase-like enzyme
MMRNRKILNSSILKFEHKDAPIASPEAYRQRLIKYFLIALGLLVFSLLIGTVGYYYFGQQNIKTDKPSWVDAFLCASMILTGMGPIGSMESDAGKIFSALYAIYSGVTFLSVMGIFFAPIVHRFLHLMHIDEQETE